MKGRNIEKVIKTLTKSEFDTILTKGKVEKGLDLTAETLLRTIRTSGYSTKKAIQILGVSNRAKNYKLDQIASILMDFFGGVGEFSKIHGGFQLALRFCATSEIDTATDFWQASMTIAEKIENWELLLYGWRIAEESKLKPISKCVSKEEIWNRLRVHEEITSISNRANNIKRLNRIEEWDSQAHSLKLELLEVFGKGKMSPRIELHFLRTFAYLEVFSSSPNSSIVAQSAAIDHLHQHSWLALAFEFDIMREYRRLANLQWHARRYNEFWITYNYICSQSPNDNRAQAEQILTRFPFLFNLAIDFGDERIGRKAVEEWGIVFGANGGSILDLSMLGIIHYWCSYYLFVAGTEKASRRTLVKLQKIPRKHFPNHISFASSLLEIALEIDGGEIEDATRLLRNLSGSKVSSLLDGAGEIVTFFKKLVSDEAIIASNWNILFEEFEITFQDFNNTLLGRCFSVRNWLLARCKGCTMLNVYQENAPFLPPYQDYQVSMMTI